MKRQLLSLAILASTLAATPFLPGYTQSTQEITRDNCRSCASVCNTTISYCTSKGGPKAQAHVINALRDCISACKMTSDILSRGSALEVKAAALCLNACQAAAKACDQFSKDTQMQACANETRKCAGNLNKIANAKAPAI